MSRKKDFRVEVIIKESRGNHSGMVDRFCGSPEDVAKFLMEKYTSKGQGFFDWLAEPFNVAGEHMEQLQRR